MSWKPMDVLDEWSINRYSCDFKSGRPTKRKISITGRYRLNKLKEKKSTDIRFTAQKKVNGVWVTTDIPLDIQCMVLDAYKELEPAKEVGPLHHIAEVEKQVALNSMINNTEEVYDNELHTWVKPQLQEDLAQRQEEGYRRLYKAIMEAGDEKNYECNCGPLCTCESWQERTECNQWQEKQVVTRLDKGVQWKDGFDIPPNTTNMCPFCDSPDCYYNKPDEKLPECIAGEDLDARDVVYIKDNMAYRTDINMLGPEAPVVINDKGGKQSKVEGFFMGLPAKAIIEVAKVLEHGREKYGKDNWRQIDSESHLNHLMMHIYGDMTNDRSEGPVGHLAHATCRSLMALEMAIEERGG